MAAHHAVLFADDNEFIGGKAHRRRAIQQRLSKNILRENIDITGGKLLIYDIGALVWADGPPAAGLKLGSLELPDSHIRDIKGLVANRELRRRGLGKAHYQGSARYDQPKKHHDMGVLIWPQV